MIELKNVTKQYEVGDQIIQVLKGISLKIRDGEFVGILGASGSGKSTLMHIIGLLDSPSEGQVLIDGKDASKLSDNELSKLRNHYVGFVFQQFNLINKYSVLENVLLPALYSKEKLPFDPTNRVLELLSKFGIYDRRNYRPNKISGGQQQRTAIARALIMNPKIILADEPTGNLDTKTGEDIMDLLKSLNKEFGLTVVIVTHEKNIAAKTKKQIFIRDGQIVKKYL
ncbi:MAG: ABC transporter ATP-binding protein [Candidatus Levybacteria bacterium RIFCSPHIGHO2_02_FULL_40_18]|nr:MAG: ABC transporter ATP-binding protein [Candidatus Levybacteria bacterium RIFCSPHIGHO2_01_FULL_40_58]OGH26327.1 MAG: ABC transporter ATP-binding protein [Candidatus Levybacteria bacterium RIFCSPHIGHO2_02_FULL_40_18]OGH31286.1 MAG: ABC transporter ATP-binding protein [Candidatus Levybacteria bacterium RIFCSPHIGHO2_12_FULL_40_31]OGH40356.1 MAG: ABC transporter ATP-binding protein [Candidatus Levybacteria bacterium RIFCSPLOWO2_01_FULL_40_64]OGH49217.1 MAG: ABC transporter ATP-binding protein 